MDIAIKVTGILAVLLVALIFIDWYEENKDKNRDTELNMSEKEKSTKKKADKMKGL